MITLKNLRYNGDFTYTKDSKGSLTVNGYYVTDDKGNIVNITLYYGEMGSVNIYIDVNNDKVEYAINGKDLDEIETIVKSVETIVNEISAEVVIETESEQEQGEKK